MKKSIVFYCLSFLVSFFYTSSYAQNVFRTTATSVIGYLEYLPQGYNSNSDKYPVVIFLHGLGEKGVNSVDIPTLQTTIGLVERNGPPKLTKEGEQFPFILISPQLKSNFGDWQSWYVNEVIDYCKTYLRIDERRIYLTGLSLGGGGTWWTAQDFPKEFAAIAPVCGSRNTLSKSCLLAAENLPVWAFHGDSDTTVPYARSLNMVNAINKCTPTPSPLAKLTTYVGVNHNCWDRAYTNDHSEQNPNVYEWMMSFTNTINGTNSIPVANAGADVSINIPTISATLNGSGSKDADGSISTYEWSQFSGPTLAVLSNSTAVSPIASGLVVGTYIFKLKVTDNGGDVDADFVKVTVIPNILPTVNAGVDETITLPSNSATLAGSATDADGNIVSYQWTEVSGGTITMTGATSSTLSVSSMAAGAYVFRLTVKDNAGGSKSDDITVTVATSSQVPPPGNVPPVASAGPDRLVKLPTSPITLFGTATDSDGTITKYNWAKISGGACTFTSTAILRPKVSGLVTGTYVFRLTITDDDGATSSDDVIITADYAPVANAGTDVTITLPANSITLKATASDADGTISSYLWAKSAGPSSLTLTNKNTPTATASNLIEGTYEFRLTITDNVGAQTVDYVTVVVAAEETSSARSSVSEEIASESANSNFLLLASEPTTGNTSAVIYSQTGQKIYEGNWNAEVYHQVMDKRGMYIYHLMKDGKQATGKVYISE
jgi:hypothetical protein